MTVKELDVYFRSILDIDACARSDSSLNGLQAGDGEAEVTKAAFAVDACLETFARAAEAGAQLLFVHHGIFWGRPYAFTGPAYARIAFLIRQGLALYAAHLPLDMHPTLGNNASIMRALGIHEIEPFGMYKGLKIGYKGVLKEPVSLSFLIDRMNIPSEDVLQVLPFGKEQVRSVGVVSGGAVAELEDAINEGLDVYITGEAGHTAYHTALESGINMICAGHYATETFGVRAMAERLHKDTGIESVFIDLPTGL
ncbi:MAG: Nif3-like dinuclear metal center hexameric protein [Spirochaetales bacterium]|nr:Nif3-like dinuclear metal center hexameric protein [Spirochaetales bacterium]